MKLRKSILCVVLALCLTMGFSTMAFAATPSSDKSYEQAVSELAEKYGVKISVTSTERSSVSLSEEEQAAQLKELEARLIEGQKALMENNKQAEENWQKIVDSGRLDEKPSNSPDVKAPRATHTVFYYQNIGYVYPDLSVIECYITGNRIYSSFHQRYLWGSVVDNDSSLFTGLADDWEQTDDEVDTIDGGRTYYVQVWGDLTETYTIGVIEHEVTSEGWRIWYEAYCPA